MTGDPEHEQLHALHSRLLAEQSAVDHIFPVDMTAETYAHIDLGKSFIHLAAIHFKEAARLEKERFYATSPQAR
jgi:hypothetical protein